MSRKIAKLLRSMHLDSSRARNEVDTSARLRRIVAINDLPVEVLQQILSHLDCLALLRNRTVCTLWNTCIPGDSPAVRRAMFLSTKTAPVASEWPPLILGLDIYINGQYSSMFFRRAKSITQIALSHIDETTLLLHPIVRHIDRYLVGSIPTFDDADRWQFTHLKNRAGILSRPYDTISVKDMLVTTPPVKEIHVNFRYVNKDLKFIETKKNMRKCILFDKEGVRLVDLLDILEEQVAGLLRLAALDRIDDLIAGGAKLDGTRERIAGMRCPI